MVDANFNSLVISLGYGAGAHPHSSGELEAEAEDIAAAVRWAAGASPVPVALLGQTRWNSLTYAVVGQYCRLMGFNAQIRIAQNANVETSRRYVALRSAVSRFSPNGFHATFANLERIVGVADAQSWTASELGHAAELLIQSRTRYRRYRASWDQERSRLKAGRRQRTNGPEFGEFEDPSWFDHVSTSTTGTSPSWVQLEDWSRLHGLTPGPFGSDLADDVQAVFEHVPVARHESPDAMLAHYAPFADTTAKPPNLIAMPQRIFNDPLSESTYRSLSATQKLLADCWYSRSHDGHVRQRHLKRIVSSKEHVAVPYVIAALGDYVADIPHEVLRGLPDIDKPLTWQNQAYSDFAIHNHDLIELTWHRAVSYWNEYYRTSYSRTSDGRPVYPAFSVLDKLRVGYPRRYRSIQPV